MTNKCNAGGIKTNSGLRFEKKTNIENTLIKNNFIKYSINKKINSYYYELINDDIKIIYLTQGGFKDYCKKYLDVECYQHPDESFIIFKDNKIHIKILEKKNQTVSGSVFEKLKTGKFVLREYEKIFNNNKYSFSFAFCINTFLQNYLQLKSLKIQIINEILKEDNILLFYGDELDYFDNIYKWICN
jgi:hypothetical protein